MAGRLDVWRKQKQLQEAKEASELEAKIADLNIKRDDWKDVQEHKQHLKEEEKLSIQERLAQWRAENAKAKLTHAEEVEAAAYDFELRTQEREDVQNYKAELEHGRRQSLAYRLECARKDKVK